MTDTTDFTEEEIDNLAMARALMHSIDPDAAHPDDLTGEDGMAFHKAFALHWDWTRRGTSC